MFNKANNREMSISEKRKNTTKRLAMVSMFGAISMVLMLFEVPVLFAPSFMKMDLSDLPIILGTFMMGPVEGFFIIVVKIALKLVFRGTDTAFVGELASMVASLAYILPAYIVYHFKRTKTGALLSLACGTVVTTIVSMVSDFYVVFPAYVKFYGIPMDGIIGMGTAINKNITNLYSMMIWAVMPFNLLKYLITSVIVFVLYKRLKRALHF